MPTRDCDLDMADCKMKPLSEAGLEEIESIARQNAAETYRGPLLALVGEVRRLRGIVLDGRDVDTVSTVRGAG